MIIRTGFVSNSSSSSFIVRGKSSMEICKQIIEIIKQEYINDWGYEEGWKFHEQEVKDFFDSVSEDYNDGILIPFSCNFDTYVFPSTGGKSYVFTCNNHIWDDLDIVRYLDYDDDDKLYHQYYHDNEIPFYNIATKKVATAKKFHSR